MQFDYSGVEKNGADFLGLQLRKVNTIDTAFQTADKGVSWDGEISLYSKVPFIKTDLQDIIPVQIKSRTVKRFTNKFSISVADLRNYKIKKKIIYFYVQFKGNDVKIHYKKLALIDIDYLIYKANGKSISVIFDELNYNSATEIRQLLYGFMEETKRAPIAMPDIISLEDFTKKYPDRPISATIDLPANFDDSDFIKAIEKQKPLFYYKSIDQVNLQVGRFTGGIGFVERDAQMTVSVDGETLFNSCSTITKADGERFILFGKWIRISIAGDECVVKYQLKGTLDERINALKFIVALANGKKIYINGEKKDWFSISKNREINRLEGALQELLDIQRLIKKLGIWKPLDLDNLPSKDLSFLLAFCRAELYDEVVSIGSDNTSIGFLNIGNLHILCHCSKVAEKQYHLHNFFNHERYRFALCTEPPIPISGYVYFAKNGIEAFRRVDNVNYDDLISSIKSDNLCDEKLHEYNKLLLTMIAYYDEVKYSKIIQTCALLAEFLVNHWGDEIAYLNLYQVKLRQNNLMDADKRKIIEIRNGTDSLPIKFGCSVILKSLDESKILFDQMTEDEQLTLRPTPIYNLFVSLFENNN